MKTKEEEGKALLFVTVWGIIVAYKSRIFIVSGFFYVGTRIFI
jgi:hypothetical protein